MRPKDDTPHPCTGRTLRAPPSTDIMTQIAHCDPIPEEMQNPEVTPTANIVLTPTPAEGFPKTYGNIPYFFFENLVADLFNTWCANDITHVAIMPIGASANDRVLQPYLTSKICMTLQCLHNIREIILANPRATQMSNIMNQVPFAFIAINITEEQKNEILAQYATPLRRYPLSRSTSCGSYHSTYAPSPVSSTTPLTISQPGSTNAS
ncbi:hypothetical protein SCP_0202880 [Sparassis crispa]|uniref:Uncharacterized protein n=1 Tax=Sparassis crispa TaxID=139825 RepID=A0A401GAA7_9APHY|nr:hypothetical protein SCP_0202880 [Sparassis crispa]GBE79091.1 hypothetical protein SCP_0202880 [Sparassis crispa]